jgi:hypothetical protein
MNRLLHQHLPASRLLPATLLVSWFSLTATAYGQTEVTKMSPAKNLVEAQLLLASPAALFTGMSAGVDASYTRLATRSGWLALGARASWSTATEYLTNYSVRNDDIRVRGYGLIQHAAGRGCFGLRLGLGATAVYQLQTRAQGNRADLASSALEKTSWLLFPSADLDAVVVLRVWESWGMSVSGGPALHLVDGSVRTGWSSGLGVTWQH